jgi:hypothetical protein
MMRHVLLALWFIAFPAVAATPYHLELEATPAAALPYLGKFGKVSIDVYSSGVHTDALWIYAFSRNDAETVTVANPLSRMYVEVPVAKIADVLTRVAGSAGSVERKATPVRGATIRGKVSGVNATRHRLVYGPTAFIDVWMTDAVPENPQFRAIVDQLVAGVSPHTAPFLKSIRGTPIYVVLNFRRFKNIELLKIKKLTFSADGEKDDLELGALYYRGTNLEKALGLE